MNEKASLFLPFGRLLRDSDDNCFSIELPIAKSTTSLQQTMRRLQAHLEGTDWLIPDLEVTEGHARLIYEWPGGLSSISEIAPKWRNNPQRNLLRWLHLCEQLLEAGNHTKETNLFPFTPATVFIATVPGNSDAFRLKFAAVPVLPFGLSDWAGADPVIWQWINPKAFIKSSDFDINYAAAAAFHFCMIGPLVPEYLPLREQFLRFLSGRTGRSVLFQKHFEEALPISMKNEESIVLSKNLEQALCHRYNADSKVEDKLFDYALKNITILRLTNRWDYEKNLDIALQLWLDHEKWNGSKEVSWWRVARLCEMLNKSNEAEQSFLKGLALGEEDLIGKVLEWIHFQLRVSKKQQHFAKFKHLLDTCETSLSKDGINRELYEIQIAHLLLRYGNGTDSALFRLKTLVPNTNWQMVQCSLIKVKIYLSNSDLPKVSQLCRESIVFLDKKIAAPAPSLSAMTYFYLMDAIANFSAIAKWNDTSFLKDAFSLFTKAMGKAIENDDSTMIEIISQWLIWIKTFVEYFPNETTAIVKIGVSGYLDILKHQGIEISAIPGAMPSQPWYPDELIFEKIEKGLDFTP